MKTINLLLSTLMLYAIFGFSAKAQGKETTPLFDNFELGANFAATFPRGEFAESFSYNYGASLSYKICGLDDYFAFGIELGFYPFKAQDMTLDLGHLPFPFEQHMGYWELTDGSLDFYTTQFLLYYRIPVTDKSKLYLGGSIGVLIYTARSTMYHRTTFHEKFQYTTNRGFGYLVGPRLGASFDLVKNRLFLNTEAGISYFLLDEQMLEPTLDYRFTTFNIGLTYRFPIL